MKLMGCLLAVGIAATALMAKDQLSLTVYNSGYSIVRESTAVPVAKGESTIEHEVISEWMLDEPIRFSMKGVRLLEQQFRYDELSLDFLLEQSFEKRIGLDLRDANRVTPPIEAVDGVLLTRLNASNKAAGGRVLLKQADGTIRTIQQSDILNYRFLAEPENVYKEPTILWTVLSPDSGRKQFEVSYEVLGLDWEAYYILDLSANDSTATFAGWVTVENGSEKDLKDIELKLVDDRSPRSKNTRLRAGRAELAMQTGGGNLSRVLAKHPGFNTDSDGGIHFRGGRDHETLVQVDGQAFRDPITSSTQGSRLVNFSGLNVSEIEALTGGDATSGGYQSAMLNSAQVEALLGSNLYTLPHDVTLHKNSITELALFPPREVPLKTEYEYYPWINSSQVGVFVQINNNEDSGLSKPLPPGDFRIYRMSTAGTPEFVASERMQHLAAGDSLRIRVGEAPGIQVKRELLEHQQHSERKFDEVYQVTFKNEREEPVSFTMYDRFNGDWRLLRSSRELETVGDHLVKLPLELAPDEELVIQYEVRVTRRR